MKTVLSRRRSRVVVVLIGGGIAAVVVPWLCHESRTVPAQDDCTTAAGLIRDRGAIEQSAGDPNASGDRTELLALADREAAMADRLHTATMTAESPPVKDALNTWMQGVQLSAKIQREIATAPTDQPPQAPEPAARAADMHRAAQLIGTASADLRTSCPTMPPQ